MAAARGTPVWLDGGRLWRCAPHLTFFGTCACIMVVELVASRLISSHLGSSLYTWTAVIAVMLAGITAGNVLGGRLADRRRPGAVLGWLLVAAALACIVALGLNAWFAATRPWRGLRWPLRILVSVFAIFILPAGFLGTLSPALAKMAVERGRRVGATLGAFYAVGSVGSIGATLAAGFWLLFALGNARAMALVSVVLGLLGAVVLSAERTQGRAPQIPQNPQSDDPQGPRNTQDDDPLQSQNGQNDDRQKARNPQNTQNGTRPLPMFSGPSGASAPLVAYAPHAIAFVASLCLMIVELLASRLIADQAGNSLYTWTSVIAVVLAGMSIGSYAGGALSDRFDPAGLVGWLFVAASAATCSVPILAHWFVVKEPFETWHWPAIVFTTVLCVFFLPSLLLGTFGPVATRMAVERSRRTGTAIGSVSAWNAAGSIAGTVASGFWLIPAFGTRTLTMLVAVVLAAAAAAAGPKRSVKIAWVLVAASGLLLACCDIPGLERWKSFAGFENSKTDLFNADSGYQHIRVYESPSDGQPKRELRTLALDFLIHGYVDPRDPTYLDYGYERIYRDIIERYAGSKARVSAFFIGGGSYTFPRWMLARRPGSRALVAEIDPMVVEANYRATGLPRTTPIRTVVMDARNAVDDLRPGERFDFFLGDAFNDLAIPYHLTTLEFTRAIAGHLEPDGAYLLNVIDNFESGLLLGAVVNTLQVAFKHVYVFCTERDGVGTRRDTFVVAASNVPLDTDGWQAGHDAGFEGSLLTNDDLGWLKSRSGGRTLTDDNAPVENLIAPVVRQRTREEDR